MKLKALATLMTLTATSLQAGAVYNLYAKDGLSLDIHGEINIYGKNSDTTTNVYYNDPTHVPYYLGRDGFAPLEKHYVQESDRRTRFAQDPGASWIEFRAGQKMNDGWRVSGTVGIGYWDNSTGMYLNTANLTIDKNNQGALSLGRQYLHTGYVTRTGTYSPLPAFGASSVRLDYTGIKNLHLSGYYNTPSSYDVREENELEVEGFGASASYIVPVSAQGSLRFAGGYSDSRYNPNVTLRQGNIVPVDAQGVAGSVEYRQGNFLLAVDAGKKDEDLKGTVVNNAKSDYAGVKVGYRLTPKMSVSLGYGTQKTNRTYNDNVKVSPALHAVPAIDDDYTNLVDAYSSFLFDDSKKERVYAQADYYLRENVRLYARFDNEEAKNKLEGKDFSKFEDTTYRAGISFSF